MEIGIGPIYNLILVKLIRVNVLLIKLILIDTYQTDIDRYGSI